MPKVNRKIAKFGRYKAVNNKNNSKGWTKEGSAIYHTTRWRKLRNYVLGENPFCVHHLRHNQYVLATVVDHKKPINQGGDEWNIDNLQGLCDSCHNKKSQSEKFK